MLLGSLGILVVASGKAGSGQWGGSRTSPEVQNPVFRWALLPGKGRWELGKSKWTVLRLDEAQQEGMERRKVLRERHRRGKKFPSPVNLKA